ncbi:MAG: MalY/PatB family protein [Lachnospiraceae bacterium]
MKEQKIDFDEIICREHTNCLKYDFKVERGRPEDVLSLWVADMDFKTSQDIIKDIKKRVEHGIFGYSDNKEDYIYAISRWMKKRHGWEIKKEWLVKTPGIVFALAMAVKAYTKEGDYVLIQQPVYYPFSEVIKDNNRQVESNDLILNEDGKYDIDFEDFERKIVDKNIKLFILCSPHNPVGRVWSKDELSQLGDICVKHGVKVVSDEIHQDFVFGKNRHIVFASLKESFEDITITCTSPGKTFNLAGLQVSNIFIANAMLRAAFEKEVRAAGYSQINTLGLVACESAYRSGEEWYESLMEYLEENIRFLESYIAKELPELKVIETQGTYLVWIDFRGLLLEEEELEDLILKKAKLWLDSGSVFGTSGKGFQRINIACPRSVLKQSLEQLKSAIQEL